MTQSAGFSLFLVAAMILMLGKAWRRNRLRRALRTLPTPMRRLLGPEPDYNPPPSDQTPEELRDFARLHRRTQYISYMFWVFAGAWAAFALFSVMKGQFG